MLSAYRNHVSDRLQLGIPPLPLTPQQTSQLCELLQNPTATVESSEEPAEDAFLS
jgi:aconitate hydratase 2 / 2-methylisocitrate dehydratase